MQPRELLKAFIRPSVRQVGTVLRTLNRMHEVIPGARVEGSVLLDGEDIYGAGVDPVGVQDHRHGVPAVEQVHHVVRDNVVAGLKLQGVRNKKTLDEVAERSLRAPTCGTR